MRNELCRAGSRLSARGLITSSDGNLSIRLPGDRILITPGGLAKGSLRPADLVVLSPEGRAVEGERPPSTETPMHLEVYRRRPDVGAVIHAHPPFATALTVAGIAFPNDILPEVLLTVGEVPTTRPAVPSSEDDASAIRDLIGHHDALLLDHHGTLAVGSTLEDALVVTERLEHVAKVYWLAAALGEVRPLPPEVLAHLRAGEGGS